MSYDNQIYSDSDKIYELTRDYILRTFDFNNKSPEEYANYYIEVTNKIKLALSKPQSTKNSKILFKKINS